MNPAFPVCVDWAVTMLFYSAVHLVDAYFAGKNSHPPNHQSRETDIQRNGSLSDVYRAYLQLKDWSRAARYEAVGFDAAKIDKCLTLLNGIETHIYSKL
jgi:hypothetical protein